MGLQVRKGGIPQNVRSGRDRRPAAPELAAGVHSGPSRSACGHLHLHLRHDCSSGQRRRIAVDWVRAPRGGALRQEASCGCSSRSSTCLCRPDFLPLVRSNVERDEHSRHAHRPDLWRVEHDRPGPSRADGAAVVHPSAHASSSCERCAVGSETRRPGADFKALTKGVRGGLGRLR